MMTSQQVRDHQEWYMEHAKAKYPYARKVTLGAFAGYAKCEICGESWKVDAGMQRLCVRMKHKGKNGTLVACQDTSACQSRRDVRDLQGAVNTGVRPGVHVKEVLLGGGRQIGKSWLQEMMKTHADTTTVIRAQQLLGEPDPLSLFPPAR